MFLLQTNGQMFLQSCSSRSHPSGEKNTLIISVPNQFICSSVQLEDAIHRLCSKEASEVRRYEEENESSWRNHGETVGELGLEQHDGSKTVSYSLFSLCP